MISIAGGEDVAGDPGLNPPAVGWGELESLGADVVVVMPEVAIENARAQAMEHWERIAGLGATRLYAVDGTLFADPGPRLVDGVELLGHILHPDLVDPPGNVEARGAAGALRRPRGRRPLRRPRPASIAAISSRQAVTTEACLSRRRRSPGRR